VQRGVQRARSVAARTVRQCWRTGVKLKAVAVASGKTTYTSLFLLQALRDWDLWGPLIFTLTLVRAHRAALPLLQITTYTVLL
jgi:hypothetical protein